MTATRALSAFGLPWNAFVAGFIYYTILTLVAIGAAELPAFLMVAAYLLPITVYVGVLISRAVHALANLPVELGPTPIMVLH